MLVVAGSRSDQCPSGALNRTSGPALLAVGHRFGRQTGLHRVGSNLRVGRRGGFYIRPLVFTETQNRTSGPALLDGGARCAPPSARP